MTEQAGYMGKALGIEKVAEFPGDTPGFRIVGYRCLALSSDPSISSGNYKFSERKDIDGATLKLEPGSATRVLEVAKNWTFTDVITKGDGWFISADKKGNVWKKRLIAGKNLEPIVYTEGIVTVYIAGESGMEIQEITSPPYADNAEKKVLEKDPVGSSLNPDFWTYIEYLSGFIARRIIVEKK